MAEILPTKQLDKTKALSMEYISLGKQLKSEILTTKELNKTKAFSMEYNSLGKQMEPENHRQREYHTESTTVKETVSRKQCKQVDE